VAVLRFSLLEVYFRELSLFELLLQNGYLFFLRLYFDRGSIYLGVGVGTTVRK